MKPNIAVFILCLAFTPIHGQGPDRMQVIVPSAEMESDYIWSTLQDLAFFDKYGYQIALPEGALIEALKKKARENALSERDRKALNTFMQDSIYNASDYQKGLDKIKAQRALINELLTQVGQTERNWEFKAFDTYRITLTLYGPGGSYDPEEGSILIYTTSEGSFKQHDNPAYTLIHEIVHIGIEASIIDQFAVPHALKERIVDLFVLLSFSEYLPDYTLQDMGEERIDPYLKSKEDLKDLSALVAELMAKE